MTNLISQVFKNKEKKLVTFITGGDPDFETSLEIINRNIKVRPGRSIEIVQNDLVKINNGNDNLISTFSISGGFKAPKILGSKSTNPSVKMGGFNGGFLKDGMLLYLNDNLYDAEEKIIPNFSSPQTIKKLRVILGPHENKFEKSQIDKFLNNGGMNSVDYYHKKLGKIMWDKCGMSRNKKGLKQAMIEIKELRQDFYKNVNVPGTAYEFNEQLAKASRVADFLELGELFAKDALARTESCGGHFREESQTPEGEALRDDENFTFVSAWEYNENIEQSKLHKEHLDFESVELKNRSYK